MLSTGLLSQSTGENFSRIRFGISYGSGTQQSFPFHSENYNYDTRFYKLLLQYRLGKPRKLHFGLSVEPAVYNSRHQHLKPIESGAHSTRIGQSNVLEVKDFVLNLGAYLKYRLLEKTAVYLLGSVGPTLSNTETERLARGFAFTDIVATGITYDTGVAMVDIRYSMRHVSNAGMYFPNRGYNSMNLEIAFTVPVNNF